MSFEETTKNCPRTHKDLGVWQEAMNLARTIYRLTAGFPKEETYGLTLQTRRCAVSIPCNIAEGGPGGRARSLCSTFMFPSAR